MPSPCEIVPNQDVAVVQFDGETPRRRSATRVIPAVVGGVFAGLLLVGLGCTPLFKPPAATAAPETPTIVGAAAAHSAVGLTPVNGASSDNAGRESSATGQPPAAPATASAARTAPNPPAAPPPGSSDSGHRFAITCQPPHGSDDPNAARPESVTLQGIMSGQTSKAALLNGVLYREGDRFGSAVCPWTIAMIDAAAVRIEKAFGDRTCGVTIRLQNLEKAAVASSTPAAPAKPRSGAMSSARSR